MHPRNRPPTPRSPPLATLGGIASKNQSKAGIGLVPGFGIAIIGFVAPLIVGRYFRPKIADEPIAEGADAD
ncbi:MAG: hypothetical protein KIT00_13305 [Rhodospirillales bacterium]|nr:hypothetical protein [Rhodospirillales bacterium]